MNISEPAPKRMASDEFIAWAMEQPEGHCYELVAGEIVGMAPDRAAHARTKGHIYRRLAEAIEASGLACEAYPDGMAVQVDDHRDGAIRLDPPGITFSGLF